MRIAILTTARSDFGPLKRVIRHACSSFEVDLLIAGSHFLSSRGVTFQEVEREFSGTKNINLVRFDAMVDVNTPSNQVTTIANTNILASKWFESNPCDLLIFLGDRWELWGVTMAAFLHGIPLAHISGGEVTEGVIDDCIRHSHTKIAALHFVATEEYARNLSLMGEEDWRICIVGECGLDLIYDMDLAQPDYVKAAFGVDLSLPTLLVTFHPSTLDFETPIQEQIDAVLNALEIFNSYQIVFTAPGVEQGSDVVLDGVRKFIAEHKNAVLINHFGSRNYLAVMSASKVVIGNSSSGIVEAASLGVPAINIGNRQKKRLSSNSVQHIGYNAVEIQGCIQHALTADYQRYAKSKECPNIYDPFGDGKNSVRIINAIEYALNNYSRERLRVKKFDNEMSSNQWNELLAKGRLSD
ncbi:UDP-N-acetylglucosamine 2-epimerase (hydrolyzing) [Polynucleobacter paneuropaeus]|nr:UDP-N-acetylglucosamine 2-epimerase (hydrolyzing) [Polynucleobacter paneuropaeus]